MAKYLITANYTAEGAKGVMKDGGTKRRAAAEQALKTVGGKVESFYFAFGQHDAFILCEVPDHASATAASIVINASGKVHTHTTVLITPEEVDQAVKKSVKYQAPGQ